MASAGDGSWSSTREKLSGKKQWCKNATAGHVADEWCTVHILRPSEGEPPGCCGLGGNSTEAARTACTEIVGSNSLAGAVPAKARKAEEEVPAGECDFDG